MSPKIQTFDNGHLNIPWPVPTKWKNAIEYRDWPTLDQLAEKELSPGGSLRTIFDSFIEVKKVEHLLSLRSAPDEPGIWHDDGSRELAFSLALSPKPFKGLGLSLRQKGAERDFISTGFRPFGTLTIFLTGQYGYEHKTEEVLEGERIVLAGWIN